MKKFKSLGDSIDLEYQKKPFSEFCVEGKTKKLSGIIEEDANVLHLYLQGNYSPQYVNSVFKNFNKQEINLSYMRSGEKVFLVDHYDRIIRRAKLNIGENFVFNHNVLAGRSNATAYYCDRSGEPFKFEAKFIGDKDVYCVGSSYPSPLPQFEIV